MAQRLGRLPRNPLEPSPPSSTLSPANSPRPFDFAFLTWLATQVVGDELPLARYMAQPASRPVYVTLADASQLAGAFTTVGMLGQSCLLYLAASSTVACGMV